MNCWCVNLKLKIKKTENKKSKKKASYVLLFLLYDKNKISS